MNLDVRQKIGEVGDNGVRADHPPRHPAERGLIVALAILLVVFLIVVLAVARVAFPPEAIARRLIKGKKK